MKARCYFLFFVVLLAGCNNVFQASKKQSTFKHIVLVWLNEPENPEHRRRIIDVSAVLQNIPGVIEISAGEPVRSDRKIVDDSFDVAYIFTFEDEAAMQRYLLHADHQKVVYELINPLVSKMVVYDFMDAVPEN